MPGLPANLVQELNVGTVRSPEDYFTYPTKSIIMKIIYLSFVINQTIFTFFLFHFFGGGGGGGGGGGFQKVSIPL